MKRKVAGEEHAAQAKTPVAGKPEAKPGLSRRLSERLCYLAG